MTIEVRAEPAFVRSIATIVLACVCAFGIANCASHRDDPPTVSSAPSVPLFTARLGVIEETVDLQGRVGPPSGNGAKLAFAEPGILKTMLVRVGDAVSARETLAELDLAPLAAPLAQARADARGATAAYAGGSVAVAAQRSASARLAVALAKVRSLEDGGLAASSGRIEAMATAREAALKLEADRANVARQQRLFDAGVIARKDLDAAILDAATDAAGLRNATAKIALATSDATAALAQARLDVAAARNDVAAANPQNVVLAAQADSARARLDAARVAYENGSIAAPADGVVLAILKQPGEAVDPASPVIEVGPRSSGSITLTAPASVAQKVVAGDVATIRASGGSARPVRGRITAVVPAVDTATQSVTLSANGTPTGAVAGDPVVATIAIGNTRGIVVPQSSIVEDPETGNTVVFVYVKPQHEGDSAFAMRAVVTSASNASNIVVVKGLRTGEKIAAQGGYALLAPVGGG